MAALRNISKTRGNPPPWSTVSLLSSTFGFTWRCYLKMCSEKVTKSIGKKLRWSPILKAVVLVKKNSFTCVFYKFYESIAEWKGSYRYWKIGKQFTLSGKTSSGFLKNLRHFSETRIFPNKTFSSTKGFTQRTIFAKNTSEISILHFAVRLFYTQFLVQRSLELEGKWYASKKIKQVFCIDTLDTI